MKPQTARITMIDWVRGNVWVEFDSGERTRTLTCLLQKPLPIVGDDVLITFDEEGKIYSIEKSPG